VPAFIPSRLITDNALLAFEAFHTVNKKNQRQKRGLLKLSLTWPKLMIVLSGIFSEKPYKLWAFPPLLLTVL
jgi:hypothetical protein